MTRFVFETLPYSRGYNIAYLYRISPRFIYNAGKFRIAPEIEYTVAAYGTNEPDGKVIDPEPVGNFRFLLGVYLFLLILISYPITFNITKSLITNLNHKRYDEKNLKFC